MNKIEDLKTQLENRMTDLRTKVDVLKGQIESLDIINTLKNIENNKLGFSYSKATKRGMEAFIELLDNSEYIKGSTDRAKFSTDKCEKIMTDTNYYLSLGEGTILKLVLTENQYMYTKPKVVNINESCICCYMYVNSEDFDVKITNDDDTIIKVSDQERVFFIINPSSKYEESNNKKLTEILTPVSIDDLLDRACDKLEDFEKSMQEDAQKLVNK